MPSPFPGMDPFLENPAFWTDFHFTFINYWREALADSLPPEFEASVGEKVYLIEGPREAYIEILYKPDQTLVAVLELLSPANKEQPGRTEYLLKRNALLHQNVHLVELDLLLGGRGLPMQQPLPLGDYHYFVHRAEQRPNCQVYSWGLRQQLPRLPVPLRPPYADVIFDLASVFTTAYEHGRFARRVPYRGGCQAPLTAEDREWAKEL